ncbi:3'-5' exoribonuclease YhaM family protein [Virgibacillus halodenitrificans]|uniref:3'-5' exoribonuclease YhaM family protein n=1 Tax=Virgibacillus halodenitrificans TaxID=1482 RepID=UPI000EF5412D|nr:HD domain-containing protein [Virgibacillus halodenitrificans]
MLVEENGVLDITKIQVGKQVDGFFILSSVQEGVASNQKPYVTLILKNKTGEIEGKIWNVTEEQKEVCQSGSIIKVRALVNEYKGLQLNINLVRSITMEDGITLDDLAPTAPIDKEMVDNEIIKTILEFEEEEFREIVLRIYKKYRSQFLVHVAAKSNHHNQIGGLAHHTSTMLEIAKRIAPLYPMVNTQYLYSLILLHDLGKIHEIENPVAPNYTTVGTLIGHITLISMEVNEVANELKKEGVIKEDSMVPTLLIHGLSSHHGQKNWGSPVEPMTIEAQLVHLIDMVDSRMNMIGDAIEGAEKDTFTRVPAMKRDFYVL